MTEHGSPLLTPPIMAPARLEDARERAIRLLTDGCAYDAISMEEFERRLGQMSRAETSHAIDALVADLAAPSSAMPGRQGAPMALPVVEGRLLAIMSNTRRTGAWRAPELLRVRAFMSEVTIDLRSAILPASCLIDVAAMMANVSIIVPPRLEVDFDMGSMMAETRNDAPAVAGASYILPRVRVRGSAFMAEVRVRVRDLGR